MENPEPESLPGEDLIRQGLADLEAGTESTSALLVAIGAPRLRGVGIPVPRDLPWREPERRLYEILEAEGHREAHSRYNALVRRLESFEAAREHELYRKRRQEASEA